MSYSSPSHSNLRPSNGTVGTSGTTITFNIPIRQVMLVNDTTAGGADLNYYFNGDTANVSHIKAQESMSLWIRATSINISASAGTATYRIVAIG